MEKDTLTAQSLAELLREFAAKEDAPAMAQSLADFFSAHAQPRAVHIDEDELHAFFRALPSEETRAYELEISSLARCTNPAFPHLKADDLKACIARMLQDERYDDVAFSAFYTLSVVLRSKKDFAELSEYFAKYEERFSGHVMFPHIRMIYEIDSGAMYNYDTLLEAAAKEAANFPDHAGCLHLFADTFATVYEKAELNDKTKFRKRWFETALDAADRAIQKEADYAKFYCTRARIRCIGRQYPAAEHDIEKAISLEKSGSSGYYARLNTYYFHKALIQMQRLNDDLTTDLSRALSGERSALIVPEAYTGNEPYAFVSYSHRDSDDVYEIVRTAQAEGGRIWLDKGIPPMENYESVIYDHIDRCSLFILMGSSAAVNSQWVRDELNRAKDKGKPICYVLLENVEIAEARENKEETINRYSVNVSHFTKRLHDTMRKCKVMKRKYSKRT